MTATLDALLAGGLYHAYAYAYPHKTAWGPLDPPVSLAQAWDGADRQRLALYVHVPFCEQRCGFCNLFTQVRPADDVVRGWLRTLRRQAAVTADALGPRRFLTAAIGGGTPTFLPQAALAELLALVDDLGAGGAPTTVEASPDTLSDDKLALLRDHGVTRLSLGVQSVDARETGAVQRRQAPSTALDAVARAAAALGHVNVDLIYGLPGQDAASLLRSVDAVIAAGAREVYLYPLYVRPLTGLGRAAASPAGDDPRPALYRAGRDHLRGLGWIQATMRCFRHPDAATPEATWSCQRDGTVGLGPGARSYTAPLHWSSPYAVSQRAIRDRVAAWIASDDDDLRAVRHGARLDADERRRRFVLLGLLERGLDADAYAATFGEPLRPRWPELHALPDRGLATWDGDVLTLTDAGRAASDVIGAWLQSEAVASRRAAWTPS